MRPKAATSSGVRRVILAAGVLVTAVSVTLVIALLVIGRGTRDRNVLSVKLTRLREASSVPWCDQRRYVCVARSADGAFIAFYTADTNRAFRDQGCTVTWTAAAALPNPPPQAGAFRSGCSGATFDISGRRISGPADADLDRFESTLRGDSLVVDLMRLICSPRYISGSTDCARFPGDVRQ